MKRRQFITLLGGAAAAWPLAARAQQSERVRRIGVLMYLPADDPEGQARLAASVEALKQLGWSDGRNLSIDTRWANADDIRRHAAELVALAPDVLVGGTGTATAAPLLQAEREMAGGAQGDCAARNAGGGASGSGRRLRDRAVRRYPGRGAIAGDGVDCGRPARCRRDRARRHRIRAPAEWRLDRDGIRIGVRSWRPHYLAGESASIAHRLLASPPRRRRWPDLLRPRHDRPIPTRGGLRRSHPQRLPVQAPTKYELVVNMKTAKALGIEVPPIEREGPP